MPVDVVTDGTHDDAVSLNGEWSFRYVAGLEAGADERFSEPGHDVDGWAPIRVPGHWELQGFAEPCYEDDVRPGLGLYRKVFRTDPRWRGKRVFLRFEGVLYGFSVWVNGKVVGEWASGFNQVTFDVTDALRGESEDNVLAVRVTTRSRGWEFDTMDCWAISGIYRDVTLFALDTTHLTSVETRTTLLADGKAEWALTAEATRGRKVRARLQAPSGEYAGACEIALDDRGRGHGRIVVEQPSLWTAESPALYRCEIDLIGEGGVAQRYQTRVGLREVSIREGILLLNGRPIKLRGVNHHEIWPEGRVSTDANTRRDLELIQAANINFVRTSHYPPHPRLLDLCDELGLYVLDEVPYIHGRKHLKDPTYQDVLLTRARATVIRDRNHASVILWSLGNENPINELGNEAGRHVKALDPTRPILFPTIGSYFAENHLRMSDVQDIYAPHYPAVKRVREYAATLAKPILFTEYAHQRGIARAGTAVQDLWELFYQSPRIAGGAIWVFQDQGLRRTTADAKSVPDADLMAWVDDHRYYDTRGFFAMDGLVYSDRTPQVDYWVVRKAYSPVQIRERELAPAPGAQGFSLTVENRHDFRSLVGYRLRWALRRNRELIGSGDLPMRAGAKETETVLVPARIPMDARAEVLVLEAVCEDERGRAIYERSFRVDAKAAEGLRRDELLSSSAATEPGLTMSDEEIVVQTATGRLHVNRRTGGVTLCGLDGTVIVAGIGPHTGRAPTINDLGKGRERLPTLWSGSRLSEVSALRTDARRIEHAVEVTVGGRYPRPGKPEEGVEGTCVLTLLDQGAVEVRYDFRLIDASGELLEAGFAVELPVDYSELRWIGQGPYAGYPGKDRQNEYGVFHLNSGDLYFPGNRRGVELAALTKPSGEGVVLCGEAATIDLESVAHGTVLSHLAVVPGGRGGNEGVGENVDISSRLAAGALRSISGRFWLMPLGREWPKGLRSWFGDPMERAPLVRPFVTSYDR